MEVLPPLGVLKPEDKHFIKFAYFDAVNSAKLRDGLTLLESQEEQFNAHVGLKV